MRNAIEVYLGSTSTMLLITILILLLIGNWFFTEALIFLPVDLVTRFISIGWWGLVLITVLFFAWCVAED